MALDRRSFAAKALHVGERVVHPDYGSATVTKIKKATGAVTIRLDSDGLEGTCTASFLSRPLSLTEAA